MGGALSPLLVIPIQTTFGWRASFWVFGAIGIVWAVYWWIWFRDHPSQKKAVTQEEMTEIGAGRKPPKQ